MLSNFVNVHLSKMSAQNVLYSYQGVIDESITEKISALMDKHFEENSIPSEITLSILRPKHWVKRSTR